MIQLKKVLNVAELIDLIPRWTVADPVPPGTFVKSPSDCASVSTDARYAFVGTPLLSVTDEGKNGK
jgi:hypothetical protein